MKRIAVTGGIAEGKSTVVQYLRKAGYETISSDEIARDVFNSAEVQSEIGALLNIASPITSAALRSAIAQDPLIRRGLNSITHPRILRALDASAASIFEVPLLIETCLQSHFDVVWVVTCGAQTQLQRLTDRLGSQTLAQQMLCTQLPTRAKCPFADRIVRTNFPEETVQRYVIGAAAFDLE